VLDLFLASHRIAMSVGEIDTAAVPPTSVHNISDLSPDEHWQLYQYYVGAFGGLIILLGLIRSVRSNSARSHARGKYTCLTAGDVCAHSSFRSLLFMLLLAVPCFSDLFLALSGVRRGSVELVSSRCSVVS